MGSAGGVAGGRYTEGRDIYTSHMTKCHIQKLQIPERLKNSKLKNISTEREETLKLSKSLERREHSKLRD
jgi:hypothetical protein